MAENNTEKNKDEEEIKSFCQSRSLQKAAKVCDFLEAVSLNDDYRDKKAVKVKVYDDPEDPKAFHYEYEEQEVPVSVNIRVTAAKTWKEMVFDKAIGDVKEKAKETRRDGIDMKKAIDAIAKAKAAEKKDAMKEEEI